MRIVFNLHNVGLGNNGGSQTLIRCAETLRLLGADVLLYCNTPVKYTWSKISVPIVKKKPRCNVMVATGFNSVKNTLVSKADNKFYYVRGFERWVTTETNLLRSYRSLRCIVNSEWLYLFMKDHGIKSHVIYPGIDFQYFKDLGEDRGSTLGGLFHNRHKTKRYKDVISVAKKLGVDVLLLNRDIKNPAKDELNRFYNRCKVWMSPSENEGLHNCPMEAGLCGAGIVGTGHRRSGTSDYLIHEETGLVYPARDLNTAYEYVHKMMSDTSLLESLRTKMRDVLITKIGDRKTNMARMMRIFRS